MVAIKNHEADRFLARPPGHVFLYLIFGTDTGLVAERARKVVRGAIDDPKDPFQLLRISGDDIAADPLRLADEANTVPLFGGRRAIHIEAQGKAFVTALEPILRSPPQDCTIVIEAGALKRDAALRKLAERDKNAAAIECYPDSAKDIAQLIDSELSAAGLAIDKDAKDMLGSLLGQDRLTTRSELAKLILYADKDRRVSLAHVEAIVADASSLALDSAVNGAFQGNFGAVQETAARVFAEGGDYNALLGAALRHATLLHRARLEIEAGTNPAEATGFGAAGGGFRRAGAMDQHLRAWTSARLHRAIAILGEAIGKARREPKLAEITAVRALWSIALAARNKTG
jgi:DNA polymerase-3 subunit delta